MAGTVRLAVIAALLSTSALVALVLMSAGGEEPEDREAPTFITRMTALDVRTLALTQIGAERATRPEVKRYAEQAMTSLSRELEELDRAHALIYGEDPAARGKVTPPTIRGPDFDRAFIDASIAGHEEAIRIAQQEIERDEDPDLVALAQAAVRARTPQVTSLKRLRAGNADAPGAGGSAP